MLNRFTNHHPRKPPKRVVEPVDEWLQNEGYYRKHEPKDPTCLFRAVSEQVYLSQRCHIKVRRECVEYMRKNRHLFEEKIPIPYDSYLSQMACFTEWGGMNEILAMSSLYKRNIVIFNGQKFTKETVVDHGHKENLLLCFTPPKQYETVMTREYTAAAGFCQSLVYQTLYKKVFKMNNIDAVVHKMLHERNTHLRHDKFFLKGNLEMRNQLTDELMSKLDENVEECEELQLLSRGITSFPYRVAKALDPNIYRNVDFDIWHEIRRDVRNCGYTKFNPTQLQAGSKCLVLMDFENNDKVNNNFTVDPETCGKALMKAKTGQPIFHTGHIQEMSKNGGPAVVFVEGLGQKIEVPIEYLKPFPQKKFRHNSWVVPATRGNVMTSNVRSRRPGNAISHRMKFHVTNNVLDKNQMNTTKTITKNVMSKSEWKTETILDNHSIKLQGESYTSYQEYSVKAPIDDIGAILENTHISTVEMVEQEIFEESNDILGANTENLEIIPVKEINNNCENKLDEPLYQEHHHLETDLPNQDAGPPYLSTSYPIDATRKGTESTMKKSELDVKNDCCPGPVINGESMNHAKSISHQKSWHSKRQSPPRRRNPEYINNSSHNGQKLSNRNLDFRNSSALLRDSHQSTNSDVNIKRIDISNTDSIGPIITGIKEVPRGNKSNGLAPRFKRNYEGRNNRNDHHNGLQQHQYRQQQQQQLARPQYQQQQQHQDYDSRNNKKSSETQSNPNRGCGMNESSQMQQQHQQQQQQQPQQQPQYQHQLQQQQLHALPPTQPQQQQQPQQNMMRPQTPPPPYPTPYPMQYNHQMPFVPLAHYPIEPEVYPGQYYPGGYVQVPYMPGVEMVEGPGGMGGPVYTEGGPGMPYHVYPAPPPPYGMYQPHGLPPPQPPPHMFPGPPGGQPGPQPQLGENCYAPYPPAQPYFFSYPGPIPPSHQLLPAPQPSAGPHTPPSHQ